MLLRFACVSWTLLWFASTQSTFLKFFRCSQFSEFDSNFNSIFLGCFQQWKHQTWETFPASGGDTRACSRRNTFKQSRSQCNTLRVQFNRWFVEYRWIFLLCFLCSYNLKCAILEVIVKIEQSQKLNLHLLHNNVILSHSCTINIAKFISVAVHREILFLFIKVPEILSLKLFLS